MHRDPLTPFLASVALLTVLLTGPAAAQPAGTTDRGASMDPNGSPVVATTGFGDAAGDRGASMDPNGRA